MDRITQLVLLLTFVALAASSKILKCPTSDNHCYCSDLAEVEIQCPKFSPRIYVRIQPNNFLHLECEETLDDDYNLLPEMKLPEAQMIKISRCPLLHGKSLANYFKNLNVQKALWLQIFSAGANNRMNLERVHLSGFEEITRFLLSGAEGEFTELPSDLFADVTKISWVTIRVIGIQLPADIFAPLQNLEFLELGHNKMSILEPGLLRNNKKLQRLNLWGNNLKNLDKESFKGLENLLELDLSSNGMESINRDIFAHLTNLTHLNLGANYLKTLPEELLAYNSKLTIFKLLENREVIESIPNGFLANKTLLTEIYIKARVQNISGNAFEGSSAITKIRLDGNEFRTLPSDLFKDQTKMNYLDLSNNLLNDLPEELYENSGALEDLRLNYNQLTNIPKFIFRNLQNLKALYLSNNQITKLEAGAFANLVALQYLGLQNNFLSFTEQIEINGTILPIRQGSRFQTLANLEYLNLANNSITSMFDDFTLTKLKTLNMSHNKIDIFEMTDLQSFSSDLTVDLRNNEITKFDFKALIDENGSKLNVLFDNNPINCDCKIFDFVKFLRDSKKLQNSRVKMNLDNLVCASPERMENKPVLELEAHELKCFLDDASSSKTKRCPRDCICELRPDDKSLILNCNKTVNIDTLPIAKNYKQNNFELFLESQDLTEMPWSSSPSYQQITKLFLNDNSIQRVTDLPPNLKEIDLRNNQLETMNETLLNKLNETMTLKYMSFSGNPWRCDCDQKHFINFAFKYKESIRDYSELKCANGKNFNDLSSMDLCEEDTLFIVITSISLAMIVTTLAILAALYYKYQKQIKMWLYSHNLCLWFVTEEELDKDKTYDAFVSYAHQDGDFIGDYLVPQLENCAVPYKLCLHERDWLPGLEISCKYIETLKDSLNIFNMTLKVFISL